jgi:hypothetical protein
VIMMKRAKRALATFIVLGGFALACQVVAGIERVEKVRATDGGGGSDAPTADVVQIPDPCIHAVAPPLPDTDDGRDSVPPFYLALKSVNIDPGAGVLGFDLDGVCTCDKRPNTAFDGGPSCASKQPACDGDGGVDNAGPALFRTLTFGVVDINQVVGINKSINEGKNTLLIYISDYNGKPNDRDVKAGAMRSHGIKDGSGCETQLQGGKAPPGWCGKDLWTYRDDQVLPLGPNQEKVPIGGTTGWVNDGNIVFATNGEVRFFFGNTTVRFSGSITSGKLTRPNGRWRLEGTLSGRMSVTDVLRGLGSVNDPENNAQRFCQSSKFKTIVTDPTCKGADISFSKNFDFQPGQNCDAISNAVSFVAEEAQVGAELTEKDEVDTVCDPTSPAFTCP